MRGTVWLLVGASILAGCGSERSSGIVPLADGSYRVTVASRDLGGATGRALGEASAFCGSRGSQAQMLQRQINPADYDLNFRCADGAAPLRPGAAPILLGGGVPTGLATPRPARGPGLPTEPPTLAALEAAAVPRPVGSRLPPVPDLPPLQPIFASPTVAPSPAPALVAMREVPPQPRPPRAYESLPPVTGMPGGPPTRALTPLQPIAGPVLAGPPPRQGAADPTPPSAFWDVRRN